MVREETEYFPKAMYQAYRFHVKRDLKQFLRDTMESLFTAISKIKDKEKRKGAPRLSEDILNMPDSFRD